MPVPFGMQKIYLIGDIVSNTQSEGFFFDGNTISLDEIQAQLDGIHEDIEVVVNSLGGVATAGMQIGDAIAAWRVANKGKKIDALVIGNCMSAAVAAILPCTSIKAYPSANFMIHPAWTKIAGNSGQLRMVADKLDVVDKEIKSYYTEWRNINVDGSEELKNLYETETQFDAEKAKELGLIDQVVNLSSVAKNMADNLTEAYNYLKSPERMNFLEKIKNALIIKNEGEPQAVQNAAFATSDGGNIYTNSDTLSVGDMVFTDEQMTTPVADGDVSLADGRVVSVVGGAVTAIADPTTGNKADETLQNKITQLTSELNTIKAEFETLKTSNAQTIAENNALKKENATQKEIIGAVEEAFNAEIGTSDKLNNVKPSAKQEIKAEKGTYAYFQEINRRK